MYIIFVSLIWKFKLAIEKTTLVSNFLIDINEVRYVTELQYKWELALAKYFLFHLSTTK